MVSAKNIDLRNIIHIEQVEFKNICVCVFVHACNNNANRGHLRESEKGYKEGFGGREGREERNDINIL